MVCLISWNVAGWSTTAQNLRTTFGSIVKFLNETNADIICIQEAKVLWAKLNADPVQSGASDGGTYPLAGWDSFWSCCTAKAFNGVTTFVREGMTEKADDRALRVPELDNEGRCLVTWHSSCIVVNVYVPFAGMDASRADVKRSFLGALRLLMKRLRTEEDQVASSSASNKPPRPVVLCGDLNLTCRARDCHWMKRKIGLESMLHFAASCTQNGRSDHDAFDSLRNTPIFTAARTAIHAVLPTVVSILENRLRELQPPTTTTSTSTSYEPEPDHSPSFGGDIGAAMRLVSFIRSASSDKALTIDDIVDLRSDSLARQNGSPSNPFNVHVYLVAELFGLPPHTDEAFLRVELDQEDGMVDLFVTSGGDAAYAQPYTCWHQYTNRRSENEGSRIDGIWSEASRFPIHHATPDATQEKRNQSLNDLFDLLRDAMRTAHKQQSTTIDEDALSLSNYRNCLLSALVDHKELEKTSEFLELFHGQLRAEGIRRAMADGLYPQAPMAGTGMPPLSVGMARHALIDLHDAQRLVQQSAEPRCTCVRLFNTAPQLSDHIGVALITCAIPPLTKQTTTLIGCKYRRQSVSLKDMFQRKLSSQSKPANEETAPKKRGRDDTEITTID